MGTTTPTLLIGHTVWRRVAAELDRVYPCEGLAVPLVALVPRDPATGPCGTLTLPELQKVLIAEAVLVPPGRQVNAHARVSVLRDTDGPVNDRALALIRRHPRLRACGYLHSHPFARGWTRPSRGASCDYEGHMLPLLARNRECGLETSFSFIACRDRGGVRWILLGFGLDAAGRIVDLGPAQIVPDDSAVLRRCLLGPLLQRCPQRHLLRRWRRELRRAGLRSRVDELFDGWLRTVVEVESDLSLVILVPPEFPVARPRAYAVRRGVSRQISQPGSLAPDAWVRLSERAAEVFMGQEGADEPFAA